MTKEELTQVILGDDAETFVTSDLGQKVIELSRRDVDAAALELIDVDPEDKKKVREIQNRIWRATQFEAWLKEIITTAREVLEANKPQQE